MTGKDILEARKGGFSEGKHPRDKNGRFTSKMGAAIRGGAKAIGRSARTAGDAKNLGGSFGRGAGFALGMRAGGTLGGALMGRAGLDRTVGDLAGSAVGAVFGSRLGRDAGDALGRRAGMKNARPNSLARKAAGLAGFAAGGNVSVSRGSRARHADAARTPGGFNKGVARDIGDAVRRASRTGAQKFEDRMIKTMRLRRKFAYRDASLAGKVAIRGRRLVRGAKKMAFTS